MNKIDKKANKPFHESKQDDSKTKARLRLHGGRQRCTIRIKPELKQAFSQFCKANDLTECHIWEALVTAYLVGMKHKITWARQSPTIELTVVREVKRVRRYHKPLVMAGESFEDVGSLEKCAFCDSCPSMKFFYVELLHTKTVYVCADHASHVPKNFQGKGFV